MNGVIYLGAGALLIAWPGATQTVFMDRAFVGDEAALVRVIGMAVAVIGWLYLFGGRSGARQIVAASVLDRLVLVPAVLVPLAIAGVFPHLLGTFAILDPTLGIGAWALSAAGRDAGRDRGPVPQQAESMIQREGMAAMFNVSYRARLVLALAFALSGAPVMAQQADPLPSWNDGPAKQAILDLVRATTEPGSPDFVAPEERLATFDQDGTLWVEHPIYSQVVFALDRVVALAPEHPGVEGQGAVQDRALGRPGGDGQALLARPRGDRVRDPCRDDASRRSTRSPPSGPPRPRTIAGTGPTPSWSTSRCRRC